MKEGFKNPPRPYFEKGGRKIKSPLAPLYERGEKKGVNPVIFSSACWWVW